MFWFKACRRCGGDLYLGRDNLGDYIACLQCGYLLKPEEETVLRSGSPRHRGAGQGNSGRDTLPVGASLSRRER